MINQGVDHIGVPAYNRASGAQGRLPAKEALTLQIHIFHNVMNQVSFDVSGSSISELESVMLSFTYFSLPLSLQSARIADAKTCHSGAYA